LLEALPNDGARRLLFVGGGGSLRDTSGQRFVHLPDFPPKTLKPPSIKPKRWTFCVGPPPPWTGPT
jgi:putative NADH-flavin reductase